MGNIALRVENLGKQYFIGAKQEKQVSLIESITSAFKDPFRRLKDHVDQGKSADTKRFWALQDISFEVKHGDVLGIIGRNGSGKSTLLKIISNVLDPTTGQIEVYGRVGSLLEVGMGFHPELTGRENIYLSGAIMGMKKSETDRKIDEIIDFSEIEEFIDTPVKRYSSGMYVRLAFSVASQLNSEIVALDEVLAVGDQVFQRKCLQKMHQVATDGRTVLFVSHSMDSIRQFCGRAIMLREGQLVGDGPTDQVVDSYLDLAYEVIGNTLEIEKLENVAPLVSRLPEDPVFKLRDIKVLQNGHPTLRPHNAAPVEVRIEYEVLQETEGLFVFFSVFSNQGYLIFESLHNGTAEDLKTIMPGKYVSTGVIPAHFLAPTKYEIGVSAAIYGVRACLPEMIKFKLEVTSACPVHPAYPKRRVQGQIAPRIEWRTEPASNAPKKMSRRVRNSVPLRDRVDRQGVGDLRIVGFASLTPDGIELDSLTLGQPVEFRIYYEGRDGHDPKNVAAAIAISSRSGAFLTYLSNYGCSDGFPTVARHGFIACKVDKLRLSPGSFMANLALHEGQTLQDWIQEAVEISVNEGDFFGSGRLFPPSHHGLVYLEQVWSWGTDSSSGHL